MAGLVAAIHAATLRPWGEWTPRLSLSRAREAHLHTPPEEIPLRAGTRHPPRLKKRGGRESGTAEGPSGLG
jgi:hypothetical protein